MYILKINLINTEEPVYVPIDSFSVMSSEQDIALGGAAIGGLYCIMTECNVDEFFYLVQKNVDSITIYQQDPEAEGALCSDDSMIYTSTYWNRVVSLSGSFEPNVRQIVATLRIGHMIEEE